jgi:hypothetical protein
VKRFVSLQFLNLKTVDRTSWTGDQPVARPLPTHRTTHTQNKRTQTSMTQVGFETTIPAFEREETVHGPLDRAATGSGFCSHVSLNIMDFTGAFIPGLLKEHQYPAVEYIRGIHRDTNCHVSPYRTKQHFPGTT